MKTYISFLKITGLLLLVPVGLGLVLLLGIVGFGIDFGNAWSSKSSGSFDSVYMFILPLTFIAVIGWIIYALSRRNFARKMQKQETKIRQQVYRAQELGTNNYEVAFNILGKQGAKTAAELSELLGVDQEQTLQIIRELLQSGKIQQDVTQSPPRFIVSH
ncbi:hypothetical protein BH09PAT4_BH09PAT4_08700 [soil metagenome]